MYILKQSARDEICSDRKRYVIELKAQLAIDDNRRQHHIIFSRLLEIELIDRLLDDEPINTSEELAEGVQQRLIEGYPATKDWTVPLIQVGIRRAIDLWLQKKHYIERLEPPEHTTEEDESNHVLGRDIDDHNVLS